MVKTASRGALFGLACLLGVLAAASQARAESPPATTPGPPDLETLLEGIADQSDALIQAFEIGAFRVRTRVRQFDSDGEVKLDRRALDVIEQVEGKPVARLVEATENGEDVLEKLKAERAERRAKAKKKADADDGSKKRSDFPNPFRSSVSNDYHFEIRPPSAKRPDLLRIAFRPKGKPKKELFVGMAVVDPVKRTMIRLSARPSKFPLGLDEMMLTVTFDEVEGRPVIRRIDGEGKGGLLFIKKHFKFGSAFSAWSFPSPG